MAETFKGTPLVANIVEDGRTPYLPVSELQKMGFAIALYPISALLVAARAVRDAYAEMRGNGALRQDHARLRFSEYNAMIGLDRLMPSAVD